MVDLAPCPFCSDPMRVHHGVVKHVEQGDCVIGAYAWDETKIGRWNRRALVTPEPKAVITDEMVERACEKYVWSQYGSTVVWPRDFSPKEIAEGRENMRAALKGS